MRRSLGALMLAAALLGGCASEPAAQAPSAQAAATTPAPTPTPTPTAVPSPTPPTAALTVCEYYNGRPDQTTGKSAEKYLVDAASAAMAGDNEALPLRMAITEISMIAARDQDPTEKKDLTTLADALDTAALSGGGFTDWDPAFEAFHVKYAELCGQEIAP